MTKLIAHRGLLHGPDKDKENTLSTILAARSQGYDVEIDVWYHDYKWYLGHDKPQTEIDYDWLLSINGADNGAWVHAKNIAALYRLQQDQFPGHTFFHDEDACVLTNTGFIWTFPGQELTPLSICVMPEWTDAIYRTTELDVAGFCSDHIETIKSSLMP